MTLPRRRALVALGALLAACRSRARLVVLGAASLREALDAIAREWSANGGIAVAVSYDASSRLARQIEDGAPADVFVSADEAWMDALEKRGLVAPGTRRDVVGNELVVVVPRASEALVTVPSDLAKVGRVALAGEAVPAGRYGREALVAAGEWRAVEGHVVTAESVRVALAWVAQREADAAVVYRTDAVVEPRVRVAFAFPEGTHAPIRYPAAAMARSAHRDEAARFVAFLASDAARAIFRAAGFRLL